MKKFIKWTSIVLGGLFVLAALAGLVLYPIGMKKLNQTYPNITVEAINIPTDADAVARGKHIATIWACTRCHGENLSGKMITNDPLSGMVPLLGRVSAPNLTSGKGGIATSYTDMDWVRAIRHGVMPEGTGEALMFDYSTMSDQDLGDLIAYLKQIPPVDINYPEMSDGPVLPIFDAAGLLPTAASKIDHGTARPANITPGATVEYGGYLSAICTSCHGNSIGNVVKTWKQEDLIRTFHTGVLPDGKQFGPTMSSNTFHEMTDTELTALWLYFTNPKP
ncbi:MAG TPA: cytochrome c [Anaerolineales bacterium]|nr:cytochrome c [Anaerolineales bacterium]HLO29800.1 cytochrome c [Anaerolineales bacterium]